MAEAAKISHDIEVLKLVQVLDREIYDLGQELESIPVQLRGCEQVLESAKAKAKELEKQHKDFQLKQKEKEGELAQKEEQVKKLQGQLSQVKTNKEYSAMQQEINSVKADNSLLEEAILRLMDDVEISAKELSAGREIQKQEEKNFENKKSEFKIREADCHKRISELQGKKKEMMSQVSPQTDLLYEKILAKKNGAALARVDGENCSSCHILLRPQIQNEIKLRENIVVCENCTRILYEES